MTMMIRAHEAECRDGMAWAEIRFQSVANEVSKPKPKSVATVLTLRRVKKFQTPDNPTGRIACSYQKLAGAR